MQVELASAVDGTAAVRLDGLNHGQVCDRCRLKKVKCDAGRPKCSNCVAASADCSVSARLQRKTKSRGFADTSTKGLQAEIDRLRAELQSQNAISQSLQNEVERLSSTRPAKARKIHPPRPSSAKDFNDDMIQKLDKAAFTIKHMGRLVRDPAKIERFAGSTTGIHFIQTVESVFCGPPYSATPVHFPDQCLNLHLVQPDLTGALVDQDHALDHNVVDRAAPVHTLIGLLTGRLGSVETSVPEFNDRWAALYPLLVPGHYIPLFQGSLASFQATVQLTDHDYVIFAIATSVILLNDIIPSQKVCYNTFAHQNSRLFVEFIESISVHTCLSTGVPGLLFMTIRAFLYQVTGQSRRMIEMNGPLVRMAQSLGLHRHARRFKITENDAEYRRRLWSWIAIFDTFTSVVHGMPKLIRDSDVDAGIPIDCEIFDLSEGPLKHPLPGETTSLNIYIEYVKLTQILSDTVVQLYTTVDRKGGVDKMSQLDRRLEIWSLDFEREIRGGSSPDPDDHPASDKENTASIVNWLDMMYHFIILLVHRPGLTFNDQTTAFSRSLNKCLGAAAAVVELANGDGMDGPMQTIFILPMGLGPLYQCSLMHLYGSHYAIKSGGMFSEQNIHAELSITRRGRQLLTSLMETVGDEKATRAIVTLLDTLQGLIKARDTIPNNNPLLPSASGQTNTLLAATDTSYGGFKTTSTLEELNIFSTDPWTMETPEGMSNLDPFDWSFNVE